MIGFGAGAPRAARPRWAVGPTTAALIAAIGLAGCGGGNAAADQNATSGEVAASESPAGVQLAEFPDGTTYWRSAVGAPVIALKTGSQLCFIYWSGLGYMPVFSGSLSEVLKQWNWSGFEGRYGYGDSPPSTTAVTMTFTPGIDGTGSWNVDGVFGFDPKPVAEGSPDPASDSDLWTPSSRAQAATDYEEFVGPQVDEEDVLTLESCPTSADFR